jgi:hypothetical protein
MDRSKKTDFKIGIGVTTTPNRKEYVDRWLEYFEKFKPSNYHLHIHEDVHYKGVAYSKNQNLKTLQDCDYIFLFDDDCYVTKEGWAEYFINSKQHHLLYLNKSHNKLASHGEVEYFTDCGGVFMFLTKEVLNKVGYMNSEYGQYGFEHAGYSNRIYKAGFTYAPYQQLSRTKEYLFAMDYNIEHKSSIPEYKKAKLIEENRKVFIKELQSEKIFYNFEEITK